MLSLQTAVQRNMLPRGAVAVRGTRQHWAHRWRRQSLPRATKPSARTIKFSSPQPSLPFTISWWLVAVGAMVVLMLWATPCCCLEARCPAQPTFGSYCQCATARIRSGIEITITCDFKKMEVSLDYEVWQFLSFETFLSDASMMTIMYTGYWIHSPITFL